ncbi:uncharacterized protein LOC6565596 [Drosophila grimshawi]|uniref:GH24498 n=1 Tax=Drosophila grimshawi TaxID=7222 RepID=B4JLQ5_DROGR|nr:uncharacterized protein LOC6565596 [Drosophila grimshawi]EDV91666.1 GH24498 [Drosophila grimshawi]
MWMGQGQRNFLLENKLLVRRPMPMASRLGRLQRDQQDRWEQCRHSIPRAASQARLIETQRRVPSGRRQVGVTRGRQPQSQEKQIQTEDIWDEQFLNAALLKCCRRSEGDEPFNDDDGEDAIARLRGTASNFEMGRFAAMQHKRWLLDARGLKKKDYDKEEGEKKHRQVVLQLAIPDITDVEQEPQLDQSLSAHSNASSYEMPPTKVTAAASAAAAADDVSSLHVQHVQEQEREQEQQRVALLGAAQARHRELIWEYNRLPLSMGTLRVRRLKTQLEQQLDRIDSDLCMLNLPIYHHRQARSVTANL